MKLTTNFLNPIKFSSLPIYSKGTYLSREEIMAREAEYGRMVDESLEQDEFSSLNIQDEAAGENEVAVRVQDVDTIRFIADLLMQMQKDNPNPDTASPSPRSYAGERHILDIRA